MAKACVDGAAVSAQEMRSSLRFYVCESAIASVIFSLGTGSFIAGLLSWMGASPATCALIGAFPQLGCIMQLVSPFLFEHLQRRKKSIILCCFLFRFSLGCAGVIPLLFPSGAQSAVVPIYLIAFLMAGFVTPGLNQWIMDIAPLEHRGSFFARRDILSSMVNASAILLMSRMLDAMIASGRTREGYLIVFSTVIFLSLIDALLLTRVKEMNDCVIVRLRLVDLLRPLRDRRFFPIVVFIVQWFFTQNLSSSFLSVYQITVLGLDYSMIAMITAISSAVSIAMAWVWGQVADRIGWKRLLVYASVLTGISCVGWFCLPVSLAFLAPVLQCLTTAGSSAYNMSNLNIQYAASPREGKTAYLGVTAALANLAGYAAVFIGAQAQPILARHFGRLGIPVLFALSAVGFMLCALNARRIADV